MSLFLQLVYPPLCLHCEEWISGKRFLLCPICRELLSLLDADKRCLHCFSCLEQGYFCQKCREKASPLTRVAAAFDYQGPAATLIHHLKFANAPYLAKEIAAFMMVQFSRLDWPLPDYIIPVPLSFTHFLKRGYNQSQLIAQEIGHLLDRPIVNCLKKSSEFFSQMGQDRLQREKLPEACISWKKPQLMADKTLLLIDDVMTTGTTLRHSAQQLQEAFPKAIYALTTCLA